MNKIIILDFSTGKVIITYFDDNIYDANEIQEFFDVLNESYNYNLKESQCQWMIGAIDEPLIIEHI
jgi:hypothetical protein